MRLHQVKVKIRQYLEKAGVLFRRVFILGSKVDIESNALRLLEHRKRTFGDQKGQVDFLINYVFDYQNNGLPRSGYFVDLACADGVEINNTFFLEKHLGWNGLLFEPNPHYRSSIEKFRSSKLVDKCVTDSEGDSVRFRIDNGMLGGIVSDYTDNNEERRGRELINADIVEILSTTLEKELDIANAPKLIDFLSLDIEGAEYIALKNFPFEKYQFHCLAVERPTRELDLLLDQNGYRQVAHLHFDVIYVHRDFIGRVNFDPKVHFAFTPEKDW